MEKREIHTEKRTNSNTVTSPKEEDRSPNPLAWWTKDALDDIVFPSCRNEAEYMLEKQYSISDIQSLIQPIAELYGVERVLLFGSYARGDATLTSDIDLYIDKGAIRGYFRLAGFHRDIEEALGMSVDVLTKGALDEEFLSRIKKEEVVIYERAR